MATQYEDIATEIYDLFVLCEFDKVRYEVFKEDYEEEVKSDYPLFKSLCENRESGLPMNYIDLDEFIAYWRAFILLKVLPSIEEEQLEEPENLQCFYERIDYDDNENEFLVFKCFSFDHVNPFHFRDCIVALSEHGIEEKNYFSGFIVGRIVDVQMGGRGVYFSIEIEEDNYDFARSSDVLFMNIVASLYMATLYAGNLERLCENSEILDYFLEPEVGNYDYEIDRNYRTDNYDLNDFQDGAVQMVLKCLEENWRYDIPMIIGPPGTGKTHTIIAILENVFRKDSRARVLVCAPSNAAVNAIARRVVDDELIFRKKKAFIEAGPIFRLGAEEKIDKELIRFRPRNYETAQKMFDSPCLIFSTLNSCQPYLLKDHISELEFDLVIIDEASQSSEIETLMPFAYNCKTTVLVGDPKQLKPTVKNRLCANVGFCRSFFERYQMLKEMTQDESTIELKIQYRMKRPICKFSSDRFYDSQLQTAPNSGANDDIDLHPVTCYDLSNSIERWENKSFVNVAEAKFILEKLEDVLRNKIKNDYCPTVGIICFYKAQVELIETMLESVHLPPESDVKVNTVDSFQGQEKDIIFISCCRANHENIIGFAYHPNRLNVALTRAKTACIMVVNELTFQHNRLWSKLFDYYSKRNRLFHDDRIYRS